MDKGETRLRPPPDDWGDLVEFLPDIIQWFQYAWSCCLTPSQEMLEPAITGRLYRSMIRTAPSHLPFRVDCESEVHSVREGVLKGRMDFRFTGQCCLHLAYLGFEAKRLNIRNADGSIRSNTNEYIHAGMKRFISGQYETLLANAGMIGYVMDSDISRAQLAICKAVTRNKETLALARSPGLCKSRHGAVEDLWESWHGAPAPVFVLDHLFLRVSACLKDASCDNAVESLSEPGDPN